VVGRRTSIRAQALWIAVLLLCTGAVAEPQSAPKPANIDRNGVLILVRSTLLALDQANKTGNYTVLRDLGALLYVLLRERSSLAAYRWLWQRRREILARRREIRARRSAGTWSVDQWFFRRERPLARREARREGV